MPSGISPDAHAVGLVLGRTEIPSTRTLSGRKRDRACLAAPAPGVKFAWRRVLRGGFGPGIARPPRRAVEAAGCKSRSPVESTNRLALVRLSVRNRRSIHRVQFRIIEFKPIVVPALAGPASVRVLPAMNSLIPILIGGKANYSVAWGGI